MELSIFAGILASVIPSLSYIPFLKAIQSGSVQPHRISWLIWSIVYTVILYQQLNAGGGPVVFITATTTIISYVVTYLSISRGIGTLNRVNILILFAVLITIILATTVATPLQAILAMITINGAATLFTMVKTFHRPWSENLTFWSAHILGGLFSLAAVGNNPNAALLAFPVYATIVTIMMVCMMILRRYSLRDMINA